MCKEFNWNDEYVLVFSISRPSSQYLKITIFPMVTIICLFSDGKKSKTNLSDKNVLEFKLMVKWYKCAIFNSVENILISRPSSQYLNMKSETNFSDGSIICLFSDGKMSRTNLFNKDVLDFEHMVNNMYV